MNNSDVQQDAALRAASNKEPDDAQEFELDFPHNPVPVQIKVQFDPMWTSPAEEEKKENLVNLR